jgi:lysyl-tRNA synthetase class 2
MPRASSSAVGRYYYVADKRELHIIFRDSGEYVYFDVPPEQYSALMDAPSKGAFVNREIKGQYRCERRNRRPRRFWLDEERWPFRRKSA